MRLDISRRLYCALSSVLFVSVALWVAFLLRFDFVIPPQEADLLEWGIIIALVAKLTVFFVMGLDVGPSWRHAGMADVLHLIEVNLCASGATTVLTLTLVGSRFPRSLYVLDFVLCLLLTTGCRFGLQACQELMRQLRSARASKRLVIYGAGVAGITLAREIRDNPALGYRIVGFLDDDSRKRGATLMGLPVLGSGVDAARVLEAHLVNEVLVTMPSATGRQIRAALGRIQSIGMPCRIVPGLGELLSGKLAVGKMREISVTDLLGRESVRLETESVRRSVAGRSVLVTGAAGSIGSELCRQLAGYDPRCLVVVDQAESELFRLEAEVRSKFPELNLRPELADICDPRRMDEVFRGHDVNSIFHAAAYKHVPIVERHICEGVRNNVLGTWNLVQAARRNGVSTFLMISSDKAVNPTSIMGLTKRVAELLVTASSPIADEPARSRYICVRFGNVLVSNGSVVPIFQKQIAAGGPVMVTHPEMRRYFMTVEEAVQLVLHASMLGKGSEIFVLEMGKLVRILDLARKMITLAGFTPDEDIEIRFSGLRPGEKLFEELNLDAEQIQPTSHEKIKVFRGSQLTMQQVVPWIAELQRLVFQQDSAALLAHTKKLVPEYIGQQPEEQLTLAAAAGARQSGGLNGLRPITT